MSISSLYDTVIELAMYTAKRPRSQSPARLVPFLKFKELPTKAKETVIDVLDTDEAFRKRVAAKVYGPKHGRFAFNYLKRPDGWEDFVSQMIEISEEPLS